MKRGCRTGWIISILFALILSACKGRTGGEDQKGEPAGDTWHMTDELFSGESVPEEEDMLRQAAFEGDLAGLESLLNQGVDCNSSDQDGQTALMFAAFNGHTELVVALLEAGAQVNQRDNVDRTALLYGSTGPFPETVKLLLDHGADPNLVDSEEHFSPLMHAAAEGHLEVVQVLIAAGADPGLKDVDGDDAAYFALQAGHTEVAEYINSLK